VSLRVLCWLLAIITAALAGIGMAAMRAPPPMALRGITHPVSLSDSERRKIICRSGYSDTWRLEDDAYRRFRDQAFAQAGEPISKHCHKKDPRSDCLIIDHIVPLEVWSPDGADPNDLSNVQLQTKPVAAEKDIDENQARDDFCYAGVPLAEVQARFKRTSR
jgi:hypothetical protein